MILSYFTIAGAHYTKRESEDVYCEPTTTIIDKPTQAPIQDASKSVPNGTTAGVRFTKHASTMEVELYCEPITTMANEPTQALIESLVDESEYLVPVFTEKLEKRQLSNRPTSNCVGVNATNEDRYERISDKCWTERDIKHAEIVNESVDAQMAVYAVCYANTVSDVNNAETTTREHNVCKSSTVVLLYCSLINFTCTGIYNVNEVIR